MKEITLEELLEAGCHFGHQVTRQNPKAREFIFESREGIHIIDLAKTKQGLDEARNHMHTVAKNGGTILIVGTKRQGKPIIEEEIKRIIGDNTTESLSLYSVTSRWIGGTLTNFAEVAKNYQRLIDLTKMLNSSTDKAKYTKKELGLLDKERQKLENFYKGILHMKKIPDVIFIVDTHLEDLAVREARNMNVPIVGIVDTNADPTIIDYAIPANDDAVGSIKLIVSSLLDAWTEGKKVGAKQLQDEQEKLTKANAEATDKAVAEKKEEVGKTEEKVKKETSKEKVS